MAEPPIERFARIPDVTSRHHRARDLRTSNGTAGLSARLLHDRAYVEGKAERGESFRHRLDAGDARRTLGRKKRRERFVVGVDEISQDVEIGPVFDGRDFDAADRLDRKSVV